jgi:hypothetical protein
MSSSVRLVRDAVIAIAVGTSIGTAAGLWSTRGAVAGQRDDSTRAAASRSTSGAKGGVAGTAGVRRKPRVDAPTVAAAPAAAKPHGATASQAGAGGPVGAPEPATAAAESATGQLRAVLDAELGRARLFAQRADVTSLIALRERAARRAEEAAGPEAAAAKQHLERLDRYLSEARTLRLALDAQEFRKASDKR